MMSLQGMSIEIIEIIDELRSNDPVYHKLNRLYQGEDDVHMKNNYLMAMEYKENSYRSQATEIIKTQQRQTCPNRTSQILETYYKSLLSAAISITISNQLYTVPTSLVSIVRLVTQGITLTIVAPIYAPIVAFQSAINTALSYVPYSKPLELSFNPYDISLSVSKSVDTLAEEISKQGGEQLAITFYYIVCIGTVIGIYLLLLCFEKIQVFRSATLSIGYVNIQFDSLDINRISTSTPTPSPPLSQNRIQNTIAPLQILNQPPPHQLPSHQLPSHPQLRN